MAQFRTQKVIREMFWETHPEYIKKGNQKQNDYPTDVRTAFVDYLWNLECAGRITPNLATKATL